MKIMPIAKMNMVNTIIATASLKVGECSITANPYKLVMIKKIPSAYPNFLLNVDNFRSYLFDIYEDYFNHITLGSVEPVEISKFN